MRFIAISMVSWRGILVKSYKTSYKLQEIISEKICILNLKNKRKSFFTRVIIRY